VKKWFGGGAVDGASVAMAERQRCCRWSNDDKVSPEKSRRRRLQGACVDGMENLQEGKRSSSEIIFFA
jgi:hypothetical protein